MGINHNSFTYYNTFRVCVYEAKCLKSNTTDVGYCIIRYALKYELFVVTAVKLLYVNKRDWTFHNLIQGVIFLLGYNGLQDFDI